jgi:hypothetical protein
MKALLEELRLFIVKHSGKYINCQALKVWTNFGKDRLSWPSNKEHPTACCYGTFLDRHIWKNEE